ncbi:MAG: STAS domain-containing protein [Planctomycetota bacterium]|nr:STAS domain-containing protein [Planctomycetota bacterium]MDA1138130.1 STAS domain-containing protein [Planctomycetota bacterium]
MPIKFKCGSCEAVLQVKDELAGKKGRCPKCQQVITVPQADAAPPPSGPNLAGSGTPPSKPSPAASQRPPSGGYVAPEKKSKLMVQNMGEVRVITIMEARITEMSDIRDIGDELMSQLETQEKPQIVLDFGKVTYLPSAMIGKLTAMHKKAKSYKGTLKMCSIAPGVMQIFKITKLDKVFDIQPDVSAAIAGFKSSFIKI